MLEFQLFRSYASVDGGLVSCTNKNQCYKKQLLLLVFIFISIALQSNENISKKNLNFRR